MGQSGSGKSTLMNILGCLDRPTDGTYLFAGRDIQSFDADGLAWLRREAFGFVFQSYNLLAAETAKENVAVPGIYAGLSASCTRRSRGIVAHDARSRGTPGPPAEPIVGRSAAARVDRACLDERRQRDSRRRADGRIGLAQRHRGHGAARGARAQGPHRHT